MSIYKKLLFTTLFYVLLVTIGRAQTHLMADPYFLLQSENKSFKGHLPFQPNFFRPIFYPTDSMSFSATIRMESYFNDNSSNQENMDVRYFSKGAGVFNSIQMAFNSPYLILLVEPYIMNNQFFPTSNIDRPEVFSVLNDNEILPHGESFRNLLAFVHYKGLGIGWHKGNRWWGPGLHTSFQMTNNSYPIPAQIIGTLQEIKFKKFGFYFMHTFSKLNDKKGIKAKYYTSLKARVSWYGPLLISAGFSRNYLTGGILSAGYKWTAEDARKIVFEGLFTSDLLDNEYSIGGHDEWDQTISGYLMITLPKRDINIYSEVGFNDNRMYFADFLSQPDHSMATIIGIRDYGVGSKKNWIWGLEWTNMMVSYSSRHRGSAGAAPWYESALYDFSSYKGRRWGAHSGGDSDDWYIYSGYLSENLMIVPALNYERHGIVYNRPAEVKMEFRLDTRYKYKNIWFGIYFEKQFEAFLGFPDYFYEDVFGNEIDDFNYGLANTRRTNTLIITLSKNIKY